MKKNDLKEIPFIKSTEDFLDCHFSQYHKLLFNPEIKEKIQTMADYVLNCKEKGNTVIFSGNGASAAIASHCALDYTKQTGIRSTNFSDSSLITAFANDYGYENWLSSALTCYANSGDLIVLISSSGKSANIINAARYCQEMNLSLITLTGFSEENPLKKMGQLNFWVNSDSYNIIECIHMVWLTSAMDLIFGRKLSISR